MLAAALIAAGMAAALLIRLALTKREIRRMTAQLQRYNDYETEKKIDLSFYQLDIERLTVEINRVMDRVTQANAERRRMEDELKQAVAYMSHDLRTPLTSISGYIQLLEKDGLMEEERVGYLAVIRNRTGRLQALLNDFFELSVIESADYPLKPERIDMARLLPEILIGFFDRFNERNLQPDIRLPEKETLIVADEAAVRRVAENLILNAVRYADGTVAIRLEQTGPSVVLEIRNKAEHLQGTEAEKLFNRFYMADRTRSGQGFGLGLPIARSLMHRMNGKLTAELAGGELLMRCEWYAASTSHSRERRNPEEESR